MLWSAAGIALLAGILLTFNSLTGMNRTTEIMNKKTADAHDLAELQANADMHRAILRHYAQYQTAPIAFETLVKTMLPDRACSTRSTETLPTVPGWSARKISVGFSNISGAELGHLLETGANATPPWTLLECTLFASPTPGRLARAELVMGTVEQQR